MVRRIQEALLAIEVALRTGLKHLCLTDPDARMMPEGRTKRVQMGHSWEVALDRAAALLVMGKSTQVGTDNERLEAVIASANAHEPAGVVAVDADSGYYAGGAIARLLDLGLDLCVPDSNTASDLRRGQPIGTTRACHGGAVAFVYDEATDCYRCPEGNELRRKQHRKRANQPPAKEYRAVRSCQGCPQATQCLSRPAAKHRSFKVGEEDARLSAHLERFNEPEHQERYHRRSEVETVFGFVRGALGYRHWLLRGKEKVACEERLFRLAYQLRKVHGRWAAAQG